MTSCNSHEEDAQKVPINEHLAAFAELYRSMQPSKVLIQFLKQRVGLNWLSLECQKQIMDQVVLHPVCKKYPPRRIFVYRFLKCYVDEIERNGFEVCDALVSELMDLVFKGKIQNAAEDAEEMYYLTFSLPQVPPCGSVAELATDNQIVRDHDASTLVTCRVASLFNQVGLKIWEAAWFLAEFCVAHKQLFHRKRVLELGAGVGLTGIVLAKCVAPEYVLLTDYAPEVLQNLRYNVEINFGADTDRASSRVDVKSLDWDTWEPREYQVDEDDAAQEPFDVLIAGDCVYDVATFPSLTRVLQLFFAHDRDTHSSERVVYFAATVRNQATFAAFLQEISKSGLAFEDITSDSLQQMNQISWRVEYPNRDSIRLCRLFMRAPRTDPMPGT